MGGGTDAVPDSDTLLLRRWSEGDEAAANELIGRHYAGVHRFFHARVGQAADDLAQRTFLSCAEQVERFRAESSFRTYLFSMARRLLYMHLRGRERYDRLLHNRTTLGPDTVLTPSGVCAMREEQRLLLRALEHLPTDLQIVVQLRYWESLEPSEIAQVVETNASTLRTRLGRARELLREQMARLGRQDEADEAMIADVDERLTHWLESMVTPS